MAVAAVGDRLGFLEDRLERWDRDLIRLFVLTGAAILSSEAGADEFACVPCSETATVLICRRTDGVRDDALTALVLRFTGRFPLPPPAVSAGRGTSAGSGMASRYLPRKAKERSAR